MTAVVVAACGGGDASPFSLWRRRRCGVGREGEKRGEREGEKPPPATAADCSAGSDGGGCEMKRESFHFVE